MSGLRREIGDKSPQEQLDNYQASLQILTNYGKAISAKCVSYVAQLVQATVLIAQIKAAAGMEARCTATQLRMQLTVAFLTPS